jgi:hypothetical protein
MGISAAVIGTGDTHQTKKGSIDSKNMPGRQKGVFAF